MNVIFLDFDGVLDTIHYSSKKDVEERIKILADICKNNDCKVVIEASCKEFIDEKTMETNSDWINFIFDCFVKYEIDCIGRTPNVIKKYGDAVYTPIWKEDEIRLYLLRHPEIEHYCVIDDDDLAPHNSDLNKVRNHLVKTTYYSNKKEEEGLLEKHKPLVEDVLKLDNEVKQMMLKRKKKTKFI